MTNDRDEWLAWRRNGIGASDVAGIIGLSPWASPFSVWASKVDDTPDRHDTNAMEFGRRAEVMVGPWFADRTGLHVIGEQERCTHADDPWKLCTVDGFVVESPASAIEDALGLLEIKTTGDSAADWADGVPIHYQCQATWAMHVTDAPRCWFAVLHLAFGRPEFAVYEFQRDADDEAFVVDRCTQFWHDYVQTGTPPPVDAHQATTDAIKAHWPTAEGSLTADHAARRLVERIKSHKATLALAQQNVDAAENELRALLGDREALIDGTDDKGRPKVIASWKPQQSARPDITALKAAHPEIVAKHMNTTTTRVLRVPNPKAA